ncbi:MAG: MHYT domain-containing protein [Mariprofundales bacterium]
MVAAVPLAMGEIEGGYDALVVVLSLLVAIISSFVAISVVPRLNDATASLQRTIAWTLGFGLSLGAGIWAMHFVAMLAFHLPFAVRYNVMLTLLSLIIAILCCTLGALPLRRGGELVGMRLFAVGGAVGLGVAGMHYTGMAAMVMPATIHYDPLLVGLSLLIAVIASAAALWIANRLRAVDVFDELHAKLLAAVVMGVAVAAMHYTGMAALHIYPDSDVATNSGLDRTLMVVALVMIAMLVQGGVLISAALDQALMARIRMRRSEEERERVLSIVEAGSDLVAMIDLDERLLYLNRAGRELLGWSGGHMTLRDMLSDTELTRIRADLLPRLATSESCQTRLLLRNQHAEDDAITTLATFNAHRCQDGKIESYSIIAHDIREELVRQEKMEHTQRLESLGVLAGGIAHDFNNILTSIMGNAAMAERKASSAPDTLPRYLSNIMRSSEKAAELCKQMLAYSGKGKFVVQAIDLSQMVKDITKLLEVSIVKSVVLKYHLSDNLPTVEADSAQMQQVIMNLVINATEAIGDKSGVITITTGVMHASSDYLHDSVFDEGLPEGRYTYLEVSDTGCGMDRETQKRIFEPFFTTKFTGRGLGMSAVLGIVRGHHGMLKLYSEPGDGTTFKMLLPVSDRKVLPREQCSHQGWQGAGTVLVIDDEATIREAAAMMLEELGFATLTATDGIDGVACYQRHQQEIVVILLDMTMPRLDGAGCFQQLRQINPSVQVVLSSGYNEQEATNRFSGKGLAGFIQKPYCLELLAERLKRVLEKTQDKPV